MQAIKVKRKDKKTLAKRRRDLVGRKRYQNLELLIQDKSGKCTTYYVPVKASLISAKMTKQFRQFSKTKNEWRISSITSNNLIPDSLVNKKISLKKGDVNIEGVVLRVKPLGKIPEGGPVNIPPEPLNHN